MPDEARDPGERLDMAVVPDPRVPGADPPARLDGRRLDQDERGAAGG